MSDNIPNPQLNVDDAQLRYESLIEHVSIVNRNWVSDFPGASSLKGLVEHYLNMAQTLYPMFKDAVNNEPDEQEKSRAKNKMVDKLTQEWEIVYQLASSAKLLGTILDAKSDFSWFDLLVNTAQKDLNLSDWDFIVVPRLTQRFALTRFRYAAEFAALDMPFASFNASWEWGVFWHELGGRLIKDLKKTNRASFTVRSVAAREEAREKNAPELIDDVIFKLNKDEPVGSAILTKIRKLLKIPPKPDWSEGWVEELFEDACSVLTFGEPFLPVLETILKRSSGNADKRHPNIQTRVRVARRLLSLNVDPLEADQEAIENDVVRKITDLLDAYGLRLPVRFPERETDIHRGLQNLMRKFSNNTVSLADTVAFKDQLTAMLQEQAGRERVRRKDASEDIRSWKEVVSGDYREMLKIALSEGDAFYATTHTRRDHENSGDIINGLTVYYYDGNNTYHSHYHTY